MKTDETLHVRYVDIENKRIFNAYVEILNRKISSIRETEEEAPMMFMIPGFVDAHVHIESSLMIPTAFARMAVVHGTIATVSDPHEIANVLGAEGVHYMLENAAKSPLKFNFGVPSCVPATSFETAGATLDAREVALLLNDERLSYLAEVMNVPGVLNRDPEVMAKIAAAKARGKRVDGHAPGLRGEAVKRYADAGIETDHECVDLDEAIEKINAGMLIQIREGSAARNFDALWPLIDKYPEKLMFCSDDKHPDSLKEGHINSLAARAIANGCNIYNVLQVASLNAINHYKLNTGKCKPGDSADFVLSSNLSSFDNLITVIAGEVVAISGKSLIEAPQELLTPNKFYVNSIQPDDLKVKSDNNVIVNVIEAIDGQLITNHNKREMKSLNGEICCDVERDILKLVVVNRYTKAPISIAFIEGFGMKKGAIGGTVAHDSHNLLAVGVDDISIQKVIQNLQETEGGLSVTDGDFSYTLPLPVAGLMSNASPEFVTGNYIYMDKFVKNTLGSPLRAPFMTLSFMALLVIPAIKLSDKGLFDGKNFQFLELSQNMH